MRLSQKQKNFSELFATVLKYTLNFKHFEKKDDSHPYFWFSKLRSRKTIFKICITTPLSYSFVTNKEIVFEKVSLIDMPNLGTAC